MTAPTMQTLEDAIEAVKSEIQHADNMVEQSSAWPKDYSKAAHEANVRHAAALTHALALLEGLRWRPIEEGPWCKCHPEGEKWFPRSLLGIKREWGWASWVGQCDDGDMWLGVDENGACWECERPTHYIPLPTPPQPEGRP